MADVERSENRPLPGEPVDAAGARRNSTRHHIRLPGFLVPPDEVGLGEVIKKATTSAGIRPCGGCSKRAAALNRWMSFGPRR